MKQSLATPQHHSWRGALLLAGLMMLLTFAQNAHAEITTVNPTFCYVCVNYGNASSTFYHVRCSYPRNLDFGFIDCTDVKSGFLWLNEECFLSGIYCQYVEISPETGAKDGRTYYGGGAGCYVTGGACPVECFDCGGTLY